MTRVTDEMKAAAHRVLLGDRMFAPPLERIGQALEAALAVMPQGGWTAGDRLEAWHAFRNSNGDTVNALDAALDAIAYRLPAAPAGDALTAEERRTVEQLRETSGISGELLAAIIDRIAPKPGTPLRVSVRESHPMADVGDAELPGPERSVDTAKAARTKYILTKRADTFEALAKHDTAPEPDPVAEVLAEMRASGFLRGWADRIESAMRKREGK